MNNFRITPKFKVITPKDIVEDLRKEYGPKDEEEGNEGNEENEDHEVPNEAA